MRLQIIGRKNSGKTTLCRQLVKFVQDSGRSIWYIKHSSSNHPPADLDTDTGRVRNPASGLLTLFDAGNHFEIVGPPGAPWLEDFKLQQEMAHDITLLEGHRDLKGHKLEIVAPGGFAESYFRSGEVKGIVGLISDEALDGGLPCFGRQDFTGILDFAVRDWRNSLARKRFLRRWIARLKTQYSPQDLRLKSELVCRRIGAEAVYRQARRVLLYWPMAGETDLTPLLTASDDKLFYLPVVQAGGRLACAEFRGRQDLAASAMGIMEPLGSPRVEPAEMDLILAPGLAFSADGKRLGRGGGFYDRLIERRSAQQAVWGVAFDFQLLADLPMTEHDFPVDRVISG